MLYLNLIVEDLGLALFINQGYQGDMMDGHTHCLMRYYIIAHIYEKGGI